MQIGISTNVTQQLDKLFEKILGCVIFSTDVQKPTFRSWF
jgi:hypothetical protein